MTLLQAESTLAHDKLEYSVRLATKGNPNVVLAEIPPFGTKKQTGDTVILVVLAPHAPFPLPSLGGDTVSAASSILGQYQLTVNPKTATVCSNTQPVGYVVSTVPAAYSLVRATDDIEFITSSGVCPVQVPYVLGFSTSAANSSLMSAKFVPAFSQAPIGTCPPTEAPGTVVTQSVPGGNTAPYGSTIDLTVCPSPSITSPSPSITSQSRSPYPK
jgi:beta-lactam-binding protein with PASTA domain